MSAIPKDLEFPAPADRGYSRPLAAPATYLWDRRERDFLLWDLFQIDKLFLGRAPWADTTREYIESLFDKGEAHARELAAAFEAADRDPARLDGDGGVHIPHAFHALWEKHRRDWFWMRQQGDSFLIHDRKARRTPGLVNQLVMELFMGANPSFMMYAGFTPSAATVLRYRATERQQRMFLPKLDAVEWDACFCATEPEAGSDLMAIRTRATPLGDDVYSVTGEKCYITAGMHPLTENTVYLVLGRMAGKGTSSFSLSCFIVPRFWPEADGRLAPNHVECVHVEDKMGLNGCANTHLTFGHGGTTRALLLGDKANVALLQLDLLMRKARVSTGAIAVATASSAYLHALDYARRRVQGAPFDQASNLRAPRVPIIEHRDVQRMLLDMKARVEGGRLLMARITHYASFLQLFLYRQQYEGVEFDRAEYERYARLALVLSPIAKAYLSDEAWHVATQAVQVHGAAGYFRDRPLEQYLRDLKILTIWEGTNFIQSQDLVRDKLGFGRDSLVMKEFDEEIGRFLAQGDASPELAREFEAVRAAYQALKSGLARIGEHAAAGRQVLVSQYCTRFLGMFGDVVVGWLLLEAASVAGRRLRDEGIDEADRAFFRGKVATARYFCHNVLPFVATRAELIDRADDSFVELPSADFGTGHC